MGVLKKLLGIDDMDTVELGTLRAEAEDIRKLIRIGHKDKKLLEEIKEEILKIYLDIGSDARLKTPGFLRLIHSLEVQLGLDERMIYDQAEAKMLNEEKALRLLKEARNFIEAEKRKYRKAAA